MAIVTFEQVGVTEEEMRQRYDLPLLYGFADWERCFFCKKWKGHLLGLTPEARPVLSAAYAAHAWETHGPFFLAFVEHLADRLFLDSAEASAFIDYWTDFDHLRQLVSRPGKARLSAA